MGLIIFRHEGEQRGKKGSGGERRSGGGFHEFLDGFFGWMFVEGRGLKGRARGVLSRMSV